MASRGINYKAKKIKTPNQPTNQKTGIKHEIRQIKYSASVPRKLGGILLKQFMIMRLNSHFDLQEEMWFYLNWWKDNYFYTSF